MHISLPAQLPATLQINQLQQNCASSKPQIFDHPPEKFHTLQTIMQTSMTYYLLSSLQLTYSCHQQTSPQPPEKFPNRLLQWTAQQMDYHRSKYPQVLSYHEPSYYFLCPTDSYDTYNMVIHTAHCPALKRPAETSLGPLSPGRTTASHIEKYHYQVPILPTTATNSQSRPNNNNSKPKTSGKELPPR